MSDSTAKLRHDLVIEYHYPSNGGEATCRIELKDQAAENVYRAAIEAARIESDRIDRIRKREAWYTRWPLWPYPGDERCQFCNGPKTVPHREHDGTYSWVPCSCRPRNGT